MRPTRWLLALLFPTPLLAQTRIGIRAGASDMSTLVQDSIVQHLSVRPDIAPAFGFWVERPLDSLYTLTAGVGTAWSRLARHEGGTTRDVVILNTWTPSIGLSRSVAGHIRV
jgi:hypothetical protein